MEASVCFVLWSLPCVIPMDIQAVHWNHFFGRNDAIRKNQMLKIGGLYACMLGMEALLFKEISKEKIDVLKTFPASTFENVQMVNNVLKMYGYKSIILITEPLHSRRAYLTWKKVNPDIKVNSFSKSNRSKFIYLNLYMNIFISKYIIIYIFIPYNY